MTFYPMRNHPHQLPKPDKPYPDWSQFLKAVWQHGMTSEHMSPAYLGEHVASASKSITGSMTQRNEARLIRPSSFLACARQTYFSAQGEESGNMPSNIGSTFAIGHLLHELSYAAVKSALPNGFTVETEKEVRLPDWWPADYRLFNQHGHVDMLIEVANKDESEVYLDAEQHQRMLVDFKSMGSFSFRKHGKTIWGEDPDPFGYLAQIATYADSPDVELLNVGVIVAGINRDSLTQPLYPRFIPAKALQDEVSRLIVAIEMATEGSDPGEEFLIRHGKEANFYCGRSGKPGYCPFKTKCEETPTREDNVG